MGLSQEPPPDVRAPLTSLAQLPAQEIKRMGYDVHTALGVSSGKLSCITFDLVAVQMIGTVQIIGTALPMCKNVLGFNFFGVSNGGLGVIAEGIKVLYYGL